MTRIENTEQLKTFILSNDLSQKSTRALVKATLNLLVINDYSKTEIVDLINNYEKKIVIGGCKGLFLDKDPFEEIKVKDFISSVF